MVHDNRPLGIFDSGIGGLTIAHGIVSEMPSESIIYFGDTQHLPYGDKSAKSVRYFSLKISEFLIKNHCKAIVIACNTASALAFDQVQKRFPEIPIFNVIDPVVKSAIGMGKKHIGVIGTRSTIKSGIYRKKLQMENPGIEVSELATPLLAPMVEEDFHTKSISKEVIAAYLQHDKLAKIDELILGCTHYPLIKDEIDAFYHSRIPLFDSPGIVAKHVRKELGKKNMLAAQNKPNYAFYVTDLTESFANSAGRFFANNVTLKNCSLWDA